MAREQLKKPRGDFGLNPHSLLLFQGQVYIPSGLRKKLVEYKHRLPAYGHQGVRKILDRVARVYYFPEIRKVVKNMVRNCDTCIRNKAARHAPYSELKIYTIPPQPWKSIAMDFVVKLLLSKEPWIGHEYDSILVITDRLTKYVYMVLYNESSTAETLLQVFLRIIIANHGMPREIISDRDKLFTSKFWTTLMALLGTKRKLSSVFYPQTDRQTERINQTMEVYLHCYVNYK
jgi:hypothetical protein